MEFEGYCVKCRKKQTVKDGAVKESGKGRKNGTGYLPDLRYQSDPFPGQ